MCLFKCFSTLCTGDNILILNFFGVYIRKVVHTTVPNASQIAQRTVNMLCGMSATWKKLRPSVVANTHRCCPPVTSSWWSSNNQTWHAATKWNTKTSHVMAPKSSLFYPFVHRVSIRFGWRTSLNTTGMPHIYMFAPLFCNHIGPCTEARVVVFHHILTTTLVSQLVCLTMHHCLWNTIVIALSFPYN